MAYVTRKGSRNATFDGTKTHSIKQSDKKMIRRPTERATKSPMSDNLRSPKHGARSMMKSNKVLPKKNLR